MLRGEIISQTTQESLDVGAISGYCYALLPQGGFIAAERICSEDMCIHQLYKVSDSGRHLLTTVQDFIYRLSISTDERFMAYATEHELSIHHLVSGEQLLCREGRFVVHNWDKQGTLLVYSEKHDHFLRFNPRTSEENIFSIPLEFQRYKRFRIAKLSPQGNFFIHIVYEGGLQGSWDKILILQSTQHEEYRVLFKLANIFDIGWSDNEQYISIAGIHKRDVFDIVYGYKIQNRVTLDKLIIGIHEGDVLKIG
jgi:hypothetical protein